MGTKTGNLPPSEPSRPPVLMISFSRDRPASEESITEERTRLQPKDVEGLTAPSHAGLLLASSSPRRNLLVGWLGILFEARDPGIDERAVAASLIREGPAGIARGLALAKAEAVRRDNTSSTVIGADTVVAVDGTVLGKPKDHTEAANMLRQISGRRHEVLTAVAVHGPGGSLNALMTTCVTMRAAGRLELAAYARSGEPLDRAGAYGVQDRGGDLVEEVDGCYLTVVGLPLCLVATMLRQHGILHVSDPISLCERMGARIRKAQNPRYRVSPHPQVSPLPGP